MYVFGLCCTLVPAAHKGKVVRETVVVSKIHTLLHAYLPTYLIIVLITAILET